MPDFQAAEPKTIQVNFVKFNLSLPQPPVFGFIFVPSRLAVPAGPAAGPTSYDVTFALTSNVPDALIVGIENLSGTPPGFSLSGLQSVSARVTFNNDGLTGTDRYHFRVRVSVPGALPGDPRVEHTSDDPELEIPPPS